MEKKEILSVKCINAGEMFAYGSTHSARSGIKEGQIYKVYQHDNRKYRIVGDSSYDLYFKDRFKILEEVITTSY